MSATALQEATTMELISSLTAACKQHDADADAIRTAMQAHQRRQSQKRSNEVALRVQATMKMVHEMMSASAIKDRQRQSYHRLAATFAMVKVNNTVMYCHTIMQKRSATKITALVKGARVRQRLQRSNAWHITNATHTVRGAMMGASVRKEMHIHAKMMYNTAQKKLQKIIDEAASRDASWVSWDKKVRYQAAVELQENILVGSQTSATKRCHERVRSLMMRCSERQTGRRKPLLYTAMAAIQANVLAGMQAVRVREQARDMSRFWVENPAWKHRKKMSFFLAKPYSPRLKSRLR